MHNAYRCRERTDGPVLAAYVVVTVTPAPDSEIDCVPCASANWGGVDELDELPARWTVDGATKSGSHRHAYTRVQELPMKHVDCADERDGRTRISGTHTVRFAFAWWPSLSVTVREKRYTPATMKDTVLRAAFGL